MELERNLEKLPAMSPAESSTPPPPVTKRWRLEGAVAIPFKGVEESGSKPNCVWDMVVSGSTLCEG